MCGLREARQALGSWLGAQSSVGRWRCAGACEGAEALEGHSESYRRVVGCVILLSCRLWQGCSLPSLKTARQLLTTSLHRLMLSCCDCVREYQRAKIEYKER